MIETLFWILDKEIEKPQGFVSAMVDNQAKWDYFARLDDKTQQNIDFVHSLGQKCDSVGWSKLNLGSQDSIVILEKIEKFCGENGWQARGCYSRQFTELSSDWYAFLLPYSNGVHDFVKIASQDGSPMTVPRVKAYQIKGDSPIGLGNNFPLVSESFRNTCLKHQISGIDFCWAQDAGKYAAEQYFIMSVAHHIPHIACDRYLDYTEKTGCYYTQEHAPGSPLYSRFVNLGGCLPQISQIFYDLKITLPDYYPYTEMPGQGFTHVYLSHSTFARNSLLVHKETADLLIREKVIKKKDIYPVPLFDQPPPGYYVETMQSPKTPPSEYVIQMMSKYEDCKKTPRPARNANEKEALQALCRAKAARKPDFCLKMPLPQNERLARTEYSPLAPYYRLADGGYISDEYRFLPYSKATLENSIFHSELKKEELIDEKMAGIVFATCANGDVLLLQANGRVARFSHEAPEIIEQWDSIAQFFVDCLE